MAVTKPTADAQADAHRRSHAEPQRRQPVRAPRLLQVGDEDAHDESGLQALTQADEEVAAQDVADHVRLLGSYVRTP